MIVVAEAKLVEGVSSITRKDRKRIVTVTEQIDLKLRGPAPVLDAIGEETLRKSVSVLYDWSEASNDVANPRPRLHLDKSLPDSIEVLDLDGRQPEIEYTLEDIAPAVPSEADGDGETP